MLKILDYIFPGKARLKREMEELRKEVKPLSEHLIPWEGEELELMSLIHAERKVKSAFESSVTGIISSIYHEHMIAYQWKKLPALGGDFQIIVANTAKYRYEYVIKGGKTSFYVDDKFLGELRKDNKLYLSKNRVLGSIEQKTNSEWWPIFFNQQLVGSLVNIQKARAVNPRAFQLQRGITSDGELVFLSFAIFKIIDTTRRMKKLPFH